MRLPPLPSIREIIKLYNLRAQKQLSQNFLLDKRVNKKVVKAARRIKDGCVVEVGPGPGGITRAILEAGVKHLTVVEKDERFLPSLEILQKAAEVPVRIIHGDILRFPMDNIFPDDMIKDWSDGSPNIHIIGNLPFHVSTPLIIQWMEAIANRSGIWKYGRVKMTLTFQKEVAERMAAKPKDQQRSRLSIMCQNYCKVDYNYLIPGSAFVPKPKVDVGVVNFVPLIEPMIKVPFKTIEKAVQLIFQHRNKIFKNCLEPLFPVLRPDLMEEFANRTGINLDTRPRELTIDDFNKICTVYKDICDRVPGVAEYCYRDSENSQLWSKRKAIWAEMYEQEDAQNTSSDNLNTCTQPSSNEGSNGQPVTR